MSDTDDILNSDMSGLSDATEPRLHDEPEGVMRTIKCCYSRKYIKRNK